MSDRVRRAWMLLGLVVLPACTNPLAPLARDRGRVIDASRLRGVHPLDLGPGEAPPAATGEHPPELPPSRFQGLASVELALEACRASALENNLDLRVSLLDPTIAAQSVSEEEARFEALFFANFQHAQTDTPTASTLTDAQAESTFFEPGVRIPLRTGGTVEVTLPFSRNETNNQFSTLNPSYTSDLELTLSHPLLRNAGREATTAGLRVASYNRQISEAQTTLAVIAELAAVDRAYWRLYQAREELGVRQQQYELAVAQLQRAENRLRAGQVSEIEVIRAQAGVAERLDAILTAENDVLTRQRDLKRRMNMPDLDVDSPQVVIPTTPPRPLRYRLDASALASAAKERRMELLELELRELADVAGIEFAENQLLPTLDAALTYRINGLGGSLSDSVELLAENDFEDWSIGLRSEVPIGNEAARSRWRRSVLTRVQRLATRASREQTIRQEIHDVVDRIEAGWQRIIAARQSVVLDRRTFEAETRQFQAERSTSTDVLDAAARLADAQSREIDAIVEYQIAQIDLAVATGSLLGAARVQWEPTSWEEVRGP
ncbi:MAG: TolC family protein [Phycisphaeraceae bacterium]|nr:TolC family protein [Phycisphaeraceae bacterium]